LSVFSEIAFVRNHQVFIHVHVAISFYLVDSTQASATTTDNSCESVVMSGQHQQQQNPTPQQPQRDANNPAG